MKVFHTEQCEKLLTHIRRRCIAKIKVFWGVTPFNFVNTNISVKYAASMFRASELQYTQGRIAPHRERRTHNLQHREDVISHALITVPKFVVTIMDKCVHCVCLVRKSIKTLASV
jgi:hypothetical protein